MPSITVYPDAGIGGTTVDGIAQRSNDPATWADIRDGAGTFAGPTSATDAFCAIIASTTSNQWATIRRGIFLFDTSAIGDSDTIDDATFSFWATVTADSFASSVSFVGSTPASNGDLVAADYGQLGTTQYAADKTIISISTGAYTDTILNATGLANISKTGVTKLGTRISQDRTNTEPTWISGADSKVNGSYADTAGTTQDPKLVVNYTPVIGGNFRRMLMGIG